MTFEGSTAKSYIALNKPLIKSIRNLLPKKHHAFPTTQFYEVETTSDAKFGCETLNTKECDEYKKLVDDIFHKDNDFNVRIKENQSDKIHANNNEQKRQEIMKRQQMTSLSEYHRLR
ncbi:hypothetical protein evm_015536 [Chilo suppressalis]|nr:hypothetical protein evm_015536 [Chilo suppressalis]